MGMFDSFKHYGVARRSGRYPWGSGEEPNQSGTSLGARLDNYRRKGLSEKEAAAEVGMSIAEARKQRSLEKAEQHAKDVATAHNLRAKGMSTSAISRQMGRNESSIRSLFNKEIEERSQITMNTADMLRRSVGKNNYIDIGVGIESRLGISKDKLATSVRALENEGYQVINTQVPQLGTDKKTTVKVLAPPGTTYKDVVTNMTKINLPGEHSEDGGRTFLGIHPPVSVSSKRIQIVHAEEGGSNKDGLIELRRDAPDLSMSKKYAQVRIAVDGTHYLKGMAVPVDNLPPGVDIRFHTSKKLGTAKQDVFKKMSDDPDNPFGSSITQFNYTDSSGKQKLSPLNIVGSEKAPNEEGRWGDWSKTLSSQVLSKQPVPLAKQQLDLAREKKIKEFEEVSQLTNPVVKRRLLNSLADDCDSASIHLKAAALPRQINHVILPIMSLPDHQIYAPNYPNGEKVVIIRHPHGGKFEIPELTVNNNNREARTLLGRAEDAVGINPNVAKRLSGADFDGDTVLVIPNKRGKSQIHTSAPLARLKDFDPISSYPHVEGMKVMGEPGGGSKGRAMGDISNLITDMTIKGAGPNEIARAVRHSMVVIDAEKHKLNYKLSEQDNGILELKAKYQGGRTAGASTLISKASSDERVPQRKEGQLVGPPNRVTGAPTRVFIDPKTGKKLYTPTGASYTTTTGKVIVKRVPISKMEHETDAHKLSSGTQMEKVYADHANVLKALANAARKEMVHTKNIPYSPEARRTYKAEVESLKKKLVLATANKPLERRAQILANDIVATKRKSNPQLTTEEIKKIKGQALTEARRRVGAKKPDLIITPSEWMAIQKGAVQNNFLEEIIRDADLDRVKALATPRKTVKVTASTVLRAKTLASSGHYTRAQIAEQLGISLSTLRTILHS